WFLAVDAGQPVAVVAVRHEEDSTENERELQAMWVSPSSRHSGIAQELAEAVFGWTAQDEGDTVTLYVGPDNEVAKGLYESLGFKDTGDRWEVVEDDPDAAWLKLARGLSGGPSDPSRVPRPTLSPPTLRRTGGGHDDRPHWAARLEDVKTATVGGLLRRLRWDLRLQPFHSYGTTTQVRVLAKVLYASPSSPADFHSQPVHDMRSMTLRGWRSFAGQVAPGRTVHIRIGHREFTVRADRSGIVDAHLEIELPAGRHTAVLWTVPGNEVTSDVTVFAPDAEVGLVSDIDDTVV